MTARGIRQCVTEPQIRSLSKGLLIAANGHIVVLRTASTRFTLKRAMDGRGDGNQRELALAAFSLVAIVVLALMVLFILTDENRSEHAIDTLLWFGTPLAIAAVILGSLGRAGAAPHSGVRVLCTVEVVLGFLGLVGMVALIILTVILRNDAAL
jgi:hypothetical protein